MNLTIIGIGAVAALALLVWGAFKAAYKFGLLKGKSDQALDSANVSWNASTEMGKTIAERRDTDDTKKRLDDGSF